ncbi:MAG: nucleotide exchange factor GrpE [Hyphomicrobiales bacterium]|jgi:molecular chaperone GrpE
MSGAGKSAEEMAAEDAAAAMEREMLAEEEAEADGTAETEGETASAWENPPEGADEPNYEAVIGALQDELEQARDQRIRAAAEMENLRRRTAREVMDAKKFAVSSFARDLLSVSDNMTRALTVVTDEEKAAAGEVWKNLLEGVEMTERELLSVLDRNGVKKINPEGERFDPNQHQAMFEVPDPSQPSGMVVQVVAPGFMIGERVLRPAMVGVTKGGPKPAKQDDAQPEEVKAANDTADAQPGESIDKSA